MEDITFYGQTAVGIALVASLVQGLKLAGVPGKYCPIIATLIGVGYGALVGGYLMGHGYEVSMLWGVSLGAVAAAGYDQVKALKIPDFLKRK